MHSLASLSMHSLASQALGISVSSSHCRMLSSRFSISFFTERLESAKASRIPSGVVVCAAKGPRPRFPRVWKANKKTGTVSKAAKLVTCIKGLSNVKEEVYGALDSFIAWDLEFPLVTVKKALKTLEDEKEWKKIIQVIKWMLSKGQGRTMGSYFTLINALAEDERIDEAEELWTKIFSDNLDGTPRIFFNKIISIYYRRDMHHKLFEVFADMEELGVKPTVTTVNMVGKVFQKLDMMDKYEKLVRKYPAPKWEYRYIKGKRVKIRVNNTGVNNSAGTHLNENNESESDDVDSNSEEADTNIEDEEAVEADIAS